MNLLRSLAFAVLLAPVAHAADEQCQVEPKVFKPQFARKLPRGFKLVSTKKTKALITQVLQLPGGFEARVTVSGCNNLAFTVELKGPGLTTKTVGAELVAIARRVLPTLPMDKDSTVDVKLMSQALEEARINVMPAQLPCGDATCQLSLEADFVKPAKSKSKKDVPPAEPAGVLKLSYDLPL